MDDRKFDDIVRSKLTDYADSTFDPGSLASLRHQLAAVDVVPWYRRYREMTASITIIACTLLILGVQWFRNTRHAALSREELSALREQIAENAKLNDELIRLKNLPPDTITVTEVRHRYRVLLAQFDLLQSEVDDLRHQLENLRIGEQTAGHRYPGRLPVQYPGQYIHPSPVAPLANGYSRIATDSASGSDMHSEGRVSAAMSRALERHYQKGVGIKVGPALDLSRGNYSSGQGQFAAGYGILGDLVLSPSISVEVGVKYFKRYYEISDRHELTEVKLPEANGSAGMLLKAEVDNWMLELPITLKYRHLLSSHVHGLAGAGYSTNIVMNQVFEYDYQFNDGGNGNFLVHSLYRHKETSLYPGTLNFSIGLSNRLKNGRSLEATIVYQRGLAATGIENNNASYLGLRTVYWFTLR